MIDSLRKQLEKYEESPHNIIGGFLDFLRENRETPEKTNSSEKSPVKAFLKDKKGHIFETFKISRLFF